MSCNPLLVGFRVFPVGAQYEEIIFNIMELNDQTLISEDMLLVKHLLHLLQTPKFLHLSNVSESVNLLSLIFELWPEGIGFTSDIKTALTEAIKSFSIDSGIASVNGICLELNIVLNSYLPALKLKADKNRRNKYKVFNSAKYYDNEIENIQKEKAALSSQIEELKEIQGKTKAEINDHKAALKQKEEELKKYIFLINKYEAEKKEQKKIDDAIDVWNEKIVTAFKTLKTYIKPIRKEHDRLCLLYWLYLGLSIILIACLAIIEYKVCAKIIDYNGLPTWEVYFSVVLPIPISLALLWGFIHEMNRAQRQLVILAKQIHEIEYVEGLLLTINQLSTNIDESMTRVNSAINKLLENHLGYKDETLNDEVLLKKEELKDPILYKETLNLLKEIKELIKK